MENEKEHTFHKPEPYGTGKMSSSLGFKKSGFGVQSPINVQHGRASVPPTMTNLDPRYLRLSMGTTAELTYESGVSHNRALAAKLNIRK